MNKISYYDTHSHINLEPLNKETAKIIEEMKLNGFITNCVGIDLKSSSDAINLAKKYPDIIKACVGIHPSDIDQYLPTFEKTISELENLVKANLNFVVAIGEVGFDFYRNQNNESVVNNQKKFLEAQAKVAKKYNLPLMLHIRDAFNQCLSFLKELNYSKVLIHCFSTNLQEALEYLKLGCFISIPGIVTFKNAQSLKEAVKQIPLEKMVIETDSPFLAPAPYRGKTNYPMYVSFVAQEIALIKNEPIEKIKRIVLENALKFFNWKF